MGAFLWLNSVAAFGIGARGSRPAAAPAEPCSGHKLPPPADHKVHKAHHNPRQRGFSMRIRTLIAAAFIAAPFAAFAGNGAPSGSHYNLNILGKTNCSPDDLTGSNRHTIQVLLNGGQRAEDIDGTLALNIDKRNKIYLAQSTDGTFAVLDGNACDGNGAEFQLPAPGTYEIYARALGKPGGEATMTTCAT